MVDTKYCHKCEKNKPISAFYKRVGKKGYEAVCKECKKKKVKPVDIRPTPGPMKQFIW